MFLCRESSYYCGDPNDDSECSHTPLPGECNRFCDKSRGYHCGPYERQVIFYDTEELGQAAQGIRNPWSVLPYAIWRPEAFYLKGDSQGNVCGDVGGMAVDNAGRRIFMVERGLGTNNAAVVHVWKYTTVPCPECSGDPVVLRNVTFISGTDCECTASTSITIGPGTTVKSGSTVYFLSPIVKVLSGSKFETGAIVRINQ